MSAYGSRVTVSVPQRLGQLAEYLAFRLLVGSLRLMPRPVARWAGSYIASGLLHVVPRMRTTGLRNLELAFPQLSRQERIGILARSVALLGKHAAEFAHMPTYTSRFASTKLMRYQGLENYIRARARGKGVLVLTAHLGAWELSSFVHSLMGYPMHILIRRLDNPYVDNYVNRIRTLHGNRVVHKDDFARSLIRAMHAGETVGILMDTNMTPPQGVFVPFFGIETCTASGLARVAAKTDAAVIPGFLLWSDEEQRYILEFGMQLELQKTANVEEDAVRNTALMASITEAYIRRFPDQWMWLHHRWKTRPPGEPSLYAKG